MWEAAYLAALDISLLHLELDDRVVIFVFDDRTGHASLESRRFNNGNSLVPARSLLKSWKWINLRMKQAKVRVAA